MYKIIGADQKEYGPISAEQVRQWISQGRVNGQTRIQPAGSPNWVYLSELPEFAGPVPFGAPPIPTPSPIVFASPPPRNSHLAIWSMVVGIVSLLCCQGYLGVVSIVLGVIALSHIKSNPQKLGTGFAIAGIVLGALGLIMLIVMIVVFATSPQLMQNFQNSLPQ